MTSQGTAIIYCRISKDMTGQELGVQRQEEECRQLAERMGWAVVDVLVDNDISATSGARRPAFEQLLKARPERIVCWHTDRLVRVSADLERVLDLKVNVHTVAAGWLDLSTPAGRAVARTITAWATYEGEQKALRQKSSHAQRRAQGRPWWPNPPFGYTSKGVVVEGAAAAIRRGCADVMNGKPVAQIAREWAEAGHRSFKGTIMGQAAVRRVLMHPRNAGIMTAGGDNQIVELGEGAWEPIIDELTLRAVRSKLSNRANQWGGGDRGDTWLLTGLLWCSVCDGRVGGTSARPGTNPGAKKYRYYGCRKSKHVMWRQEWLEEYVTSATLAVLSRPEWGSVWESEGEDRSGLQIEEKRLLGLLDDLLDERVEGRLTTEQYNRTADRARARLAEIQGQLAGTGAVERHELHEAHEQAQEWDNLDLNSRREVIRAVFPRIVLGKSGSSRWHPPDKNAVRLA